jgi:hypothetical protein
MMLKQLLLTTMATSLLVLLAAPARAQECEEGWCGDPNACELCSQSGWSCTHACKDGTIWTNCGEWIGYPPNDLDDDGVANPSDNCLCDYNPNQADCDTDGSGDVCDSQNERWVFVQDLGRCDWDLHATWFEWDVQQIGAVRYRELCSGSFCSDRYVIDEQSCTFGFDYCGSTGLHCCECRFGTNNCGGEGSGTCGSPNCPF